MREKILADQLKSSAQARLIRQGASKAERRCAPFVGEALALFKSVVRHQGGDQIEGDVIALKQSFEILIAVVMDFG